MREIPQIQQQPKTQADSNVHYGYVAFRSINLGDLRGERRVQPPTSPYFYELPAKEVIPFTNIEVPVVKTDSKEIMADAVQSGASPFPPLPPNGQLGADPTVIHKPKSARECAEQLLDGYEQWGYKVLYPLTGYDERSVFLVMQTLTPFTYKLTDLPEALDTAEERIEATQNYFVEEPYPSGEPISIEIAPLSAELKAVALQVLPLLRESANAALTFAEEVESRTRQAMETYFAGNGGKRSADPLDRYVFAELDKAIPTRIGSEAKKADPTADAIKQLAEAMVQNTQAGNDAAAQKQAQLDELIRKAQEQLEQINAMAASANGKMKTKEPKE